MNRKTASSGRRAGATHQSSEEAHSDAAGFPEETLTQGAQRLNRQEEQAKTEDLSQGYWGREPGRAARIPRECCREMQTSPSRSTWQPWGHKVIHPAAGLKIATSRRFLKYIAITVSRLSLTVMRPSPSTDAASSAIVAVLFARPPNTAV